MVAFQSFHLEIFWGPWRSNKTSRLGGDTRLTCAGRLARKPPLPQTLRKSLEDFPGTREFGRHRAVQQTRWIGNQDSGTQTINFRVVLHHKLLKQSGFSGILYHFVCLSVLHTLHVDPSYRALRCSAFKVLLQTSESPIVNTYLFCVVSQPSKKLSQANDVVVLFLGPCLVLGKARKL